MWKDRFQGSCVNRSSYIFQYMSHRVAEPAVGYRRCEAGNNERKTPWAEPIHEAINPPVLPAPGRGGAISHFPQQEQLWHSQTNMSVAQDQRQLSFNGNSSRVGRLIDCLNLFVDWDTIYQQAFELLKEHSKVRGLVFIMILMFLDHPTVVQPSLLVTRCKKTQSVPFYVGEKLQGE